MKWGEFCHHDSTLGRWLGAEGVRRGTHRMFTPEETLARVRRLLPVMGITRAANVTGLDAIGIPVVMVCRPNSRSLAVSQGKGIDLASARVSGVMESVESYHGEHITLPLRYASYEQLRYTHPIADLTGLPRTADSLFHPHRMLLWIEGVDLLGNGPCWVPYRDRVDGLQGAVCSRQWLLRRDQ